MCFLFYSSIPTFKFFQGTLVQLRGRVLTQDMQGPRLHPHHAWVWVSKVTTVQKLHTVYHVKPGLTDRLLISWVGSQPRLQWLAPVAIAFHLCAPSIHNISRGIVCVSWCLLQSYYVTFFSPASWWQPAIELQLWALVSWTVVKELWWHLKCF